MSTATRLKIQKSLSFKIQTVKEFTDRNPVLPGKFKATVGEAIVHGSDLHVTYLDLCGMRYPVAVQEVLK